MSRPELVVIDIELQLRGRLAAVLEVEARRRKRSPAELLADVIEAVLEDGLLDAVLDDASDARATEVR